MSKPKLLFVSQQAPWPKDSGGNIRSAAMLEGLAQEFAISLVASAPSEDVRGEVERGEVERALGKWCGEVLLVSDTKGRNVLSAGRTVGRSLLRGSPLLIEHNRNVHLIAAVRERLASGGFSRVYLNHVDTVPCVEGVESPPLVLDTHNLYFDYFARLASRATNPLKRWLHARESRRLAEYELEACRLAAAVIVCSQREREMLLALNEGLKVEVVPNGADCDALQLTDADPFDNPPTLAFVGDMAYGPNDDAVKWFVAEVLPRLRERVADAGFLVVGKNPSESLRELEGAHEGVEVTGFVEDVGAVLARARAVVVPLRYGAGTRLKVLEALALGMPTVSTRLGAEGIELEDGREILLADGAEGLAAGCARVLTESGLHARLRREGRRAVEESFDWRALGGVVRGVVRGAE